MKIHLKIEVNKLLKIIVVLILFIGVSSCSKEKEEEIPFVAAPFNIKIISGDSQTAQIESMLANEIEIQLLDQEGDPFAGATINFSLTQGLLSAQTAITNVEGKTSVFWTLGEDTGEQVLTITVNNTVSPLLVTATGTLERGDFYKGGIVFYIDDSKKHGFVCAVRDQSKAAQWGCLNTEIDGANSTTPGSGKQNTIDIEKDCTTAGTAADLCANLVSNGFSDWFLPGRQLVFQFSRSSSEISKGSRANGGAAFSTNNGYWSSSEFNKDEAYKSTGAPTGARRPFPKNTLGGVRAVRAF